MLLDIFTINLLFNGFVRGLTKFDSDLTIYISIQIFIIMILMITNVSLN